MANQGPGGGWGQAPGGGQPGWGPPQGQAPYGGHGGAPQGGGPHGGGPYGGGPYGGAPYGGPVQAMPPAQPPPKKSGVSGCLIAAAILGGLVLLGGGVGAYLLYREVGGFVGATGDMAKIMMKAQSAPGTDEMRDAGCSTAVAIDTEELANAIQRFEDEMAKREKRAPKDISRDLGDASAILQCQTSKSSLDCQTIADAYRKAAKPKGRMLVSVTSSSGSQSCSESFERDGTKIGAAEMPDLPE